MLKVAWVSTAAGFWKLTGPGPLSSVQLLVVAAGGLGRPSSLTVASSAAAAGSVTVRSGPAFTTGATFGGGGGAGWSVIWVVSLSLSVLSLAVRRRAEVAAMLKVAWVSTAAGAWKLTG